MIETPLVALTLVACGLLTVLILGRALRDVWAGHADDRMETEG